MREWNPLGKHLVDKTPASPFHKSLEVYIKHCSIQCVNSQTSAATWHLPVFALSLSMAYIMIPWVFQLFWSTWFIVVSHYSICYMAFVHNHGSVDKNNEFLRSQNVTELWRGTVFFICIICSLCRRENQNLAIGLLSNSRFARTWITWRTSRKIRRREERWCSFLYKTHKYTQNWL